MSHPFRAYVRAVEKAARTAGFSLGMSQLRDSISKALVNRPYSAAVAAADANRLPTIELPPPFLAAAAEHYKFELSLFASIFPPIETALASPSPHPILRSSSIKELLAISKDSRLRSIRNRLTSIRDSDLALVLKMELANLAGIAYLLATSFDDRLKSTEPLTISLFGMEPVFMGDQGKALQLITGMIDSKCSLRFEIVIDRMGAVLLEQDLEGFETGFIEWVKTEPAATFYDDYRHYKSVANCDVAIACYPDWIDHVNDIERSAWVQDFVDKDIPIMGMCYDDLQQDVIAAVVRGYGFGEAVLFNSPASISVNGPGFTNHLGQYLFSIDASRGNKGSLRQNNWINHAQLLNDLIREHRSNFKGAPTPGTIIQFDQARLAFGTNDRAVDVETGDAYVIDQLSPKGMGLRNFGVDKDKDWEPLSKTESLRRSEVIMWVENYHHEPLFHPDELTEMRQEADGFIESILSDLPPEDRSKYEEFLSAMFKGESGVSAGMPIFIAATKNSADAIRSAVANGADVNGRDTEGWTPLAEAASQNSVDAAKALLELGADPNIPTTIGHYPITIAISRGQDAVALALLEGGANPDIKSVNGQSATMFFKQGFISSPALKDWFLKRPV